MDLLIAASQKETDLGVTDVEIFLAAKKQEFGRVSLAENSPKHFPTTKISSPSHSLASGTENTPLMRCTMILSLVHLDQSLSSVKMKEKIEEGNFL